MSRIAQIKRETRETNIRVDLNIDGSGKYDICTGVRMFDHMLAQLSRHGLFDIKILASGDDVHHLVEDVAITLGQVFVKALDEKSGLVRFGEATIPMDDALTSVAIDIGGRGYCVIDLKLVENDMSDLPTDMIRHFLETFTREAKINLHVRVFYGTNDHHKVEAVFKALARALDKATCIDLRLKGEHPSTKN
jgi:imidazoleglycerol-phosphate dehydratase